MIQAIFYKEWIKTRGILALCLLLSVGFVVYIQMRIGRVIELKGVAHIWEIILLKDATFIDLIRYVPLALGVLIALAQYIPEIHHKRLKLTLHLPVKQQKIVLLTAAYGLLSLAIIFMINYLLFWLYLRAHFASEIIGHILWTSVPWYVAGIASYAFTAWICVEPTWKFRIINTIFAVGFLRLLFLSPHPRAYNSVLWFLALLSIIFVGFVWLSITRFKAGKQD